MSELWLFLLLAVLLSVTPGPDALLVLRSSVQGGGRLGSATAIGAATGSAVWGLLAAVGLATVVAQSATAYQAIRLAGAAYLILLGARTLLAGRSTGGTVTTPPPNADRGSEGAGLRRAFGAGLLSDLLNPTVGLFYLAVVPQFIPPGAPVLQYSLLLTALEILVALTWLLLLAWLAHAALAWLRRPAVDRWSQRLLGVSLIGIGTVVAVEP